MSIVSLLVFISFFFFFQAEDGIRDWSVTGVQTCALPIFHRAPGRRLRVGALAEQVTLSRTGMTRLLDRVERDGLISRQPAPEDRRGSYVVITAAGSAVLRKMWPEIGRASCRERVEVAVVA